MKSFKSNDKKLSRAELKMIKGGSAPVRAYDCPRDDLACIRNCKSIGYRGGYCIWEYCICTNGN